MGAGLSQSTRDWYCKEIMKILKKHGRASVGTIIGELKRIPQRRYPITEERIVAFLKYLRATGQVKYYKSPKRAISSKWENV